MGKNHILWISKIIHFFILTNEMIFRVYAVKIGIKKLFENFILKNMTADFSAIKITSFTLSIVEDMLISLKMPIIENKLEFLSLTIF